MKNLFFYLLSIVFCTELFSQTCIVENDNIKGTYAGECKKGKAHGIGKSIGIDSYEGSFKSGLPEGQGIYTYQNQDVFIGKFVKGLREGAGIMRFNRQQVDDSIVTGFWKKDIYIGKNENPWEVYSRSGSIREVRVEFIPDNTNKIRVIVTNTTGGVASLGVTMPSFTVTNASVLKGSYGQMTSLETHVKAAETSFLEVSFPFRVKLSIMSEEVDIEFFEKGSYSVSIFINK
ncbi:MAG: hypothetical protein EPO57_00880 [Chitinophagaceae bacterium]|nr:MAG: hypothetical protein EPO57_00880 [Chitinophagaceae bacterium]